MGFKLTKHEFIPKEPDVVTLLRSWNYSGHRTSPMLKSEWLCSFVNEVFKVRNWYNETGEVIDIYDVNTISITKKHALMFFEMNNFRYSEYFPQSGEYLGVLNETFAVFLDNELGDDIDYIYVGTRDNPKLCKIFIQGYDN